MFNLALSYIQYTSIEKLLIRIISGDFLQTNGFFLIVLFLNTCEVPKKSKNDNQLNGI